MRLMLFAMSVFLWCCFATAQAQPPPRTPPDHDLQDLAAQLNLSVPELEQRVAAVIAEADQYNKAKRIRAQHKRIQQLIVSAFVITLLLLIAVKSRRLSDITEARLQRACLSLLAVLGSALFLSSSIFALIAGQIGIPRRTGGPSYATWENEPLFFLLSLALKTALGVWLLRAGLRKAAGKTAFPKRQGT